MTLPQSSFSFSSYKLDHFRFWTSVPSILLKVPNSLESSGHSQHSMEPVPGSLWQAWESTKLVLCELPVTFRYTIETVAYYLLLANKIVSKCQSVGEDDRQIWISRVCDKNKEKYDHANESQITLPSFKKKNLQEPRLLIKKLEHLLRVNHNERNEPIYFRLNEGWWFMNSFFK